MLAGFSRLFPLWALLGSAVAWWWPGWFTPLSPAILALLGVVMFAMGLTLRGSDFVEVARRPGVIALGTGLQFVLMPLIAFGVARLLQLPEALLVGLVLVGACPGGTASNVICFLARGDVALSVTLTAVSTVLAVLATPLLVWLYVGQTVSVPVGQMLLTIFQVVLVPVTLGVLGRRLLGEWHTVVEPWLAPLAVVVIVLIIAIVVALNHAQLAVLGPAAVLAVVLHNLLGLAAGYGGARLFGMDEATRRTLAIEVGMQNSGLGVALANQYFSAAAALPGALFSIWHNLSGSLLAAWWARRPPAV